ncbi:aromatic ring-hydroxylating oxygenase subunit alpha [Candidatus Poriferisodalis sp.]|uniref:aromatic ring-hydroxylating oxygenase subunit alpha n=1 Tax=Candidatus Poriferisodalis sp. TaxID=3101277 RepID=UPI003B5CF575
MNSPDGAVPTHGDDRGVAERPRQRALPARYYTDPAIHAAELSVVFARSWQLVGHVSQVSRPGQVLTTVVGDEPIFVVNDGGEIRAFFNVCQHRGHELFPPQSEGGDVADTPGVIMCPYHAWVYGLDGRLLNARSRDVGELCIPRIAVDQLAGFLFVNVNPDAVPLAQYAPRVADEILAIIPQSATRVLTWRRTHLIAANWKIAVENYNECYHCPNVHRSFTSGVVDPASYRVIPDGTVIRHTATGVDSDRSFYTRPAASDAYAAFYIWPASSIQCYPGQALNTYRWVPRGPDQTLLVREWWFDSAEPTDVQREIIDLDWNTTVSEDLRLVESTQRGVRSRGYRPGPLITEPSGVASVHSEDAVPHLGGLLLSALGDERPPNER